MIIRHADQFEEERFDSFLARGKQCMRQVGHVPTQWLADIVHNQIAMITDTFSCLNQARLADIFQRASFEQPVDGLFLGPVLIGEDLLFIRERLLVSALGFVSLGFQTGPGIQMPR